MIVEVPHNQGTLHPGMEPIPATGYGKIGETAKKSHKNDSRLQVFKLRGKVDKVWANNTGEKKEQRRLNRSYYYWKEKSIQWERFFELAPSKVTRGTDTNYLRKGKERNTRAEIFQCKSCRFMECIG